MTVPIESTGPESLRIIEEIKRTIMSDRYGHFDLCGANVCFFEMEEDDCLPHRVEIVFPFDCVIVEYADLRDNPGPIVAGLIGYINALKRAVEIKIAVDNV